MGFGPQWGGGAMRQRGRVPWYQTRSRQYFWGPGGGAPRPVGEDSPGQLSLRPELPTLGSSRKQRDATCSFFLCFVHIRTNVTPRVTLYSQVLEGKAFKAIKAVCATG